MIVRRLVAVLVVVLLAVVAADLALVATRRDSPGRPTAARTSPRPDPFAPLAQAVTAYNKARATLLADQATVVGVATYLDEVDGLAATGDPDALARHQPRLAAQVRRGRAARQRLGADRVRYTSALDELASAGARLLDGGAADALAAAVTAGRREVAAATAFERAGNRLWPAYDVLAVREPRWYDRAHDGWFRSTAEAGDAYAVALAPVRARLQAGRSAFAAADALRRRSGAVAASILARASRVLARPPT